MHTHEACNLEPTESAGKLLNTFQLKGLRKILQLHTTFINRSNTNEYMYKRANEVTNAPSAGIHRKIPSQKFSENGD